MYLFAGEQRDPNLGLDYLRARYLDVSTGRFASRDSFAGIRTIPLSLNKYLYGHANPVINIDPSGHITLIGLNLEGLFSTTIRSAQANVASVTANRVAGKSLELFVTNTLRDFTTRYGGQVFTQVRFAGPDGIRFADAVVKLGNRFVVIEVKTNIPLAGNSLVRLGGQIRTFTSGAPTTSLIQGQAAEVIVITEQSAAAIEASFLAIESQVATGTLSGVLQGTINLTTVLRGVLLGL